MGVGRFSKKRVLATGFLWLGFAVLVALIGPHPVRADDDSVHNEMPVEEVTVAAEGEGYASAADAEWLTGIEQAEETDPTLDPAANVPVYRLYNWRTSEHLYTTNKGEYDTLYARTGGDWLQEGIAWYAPSSSRTPVYRLYNPGLGDHHYTASKNERDTLIARHGWRSEGVAFYSDDSRRVPLYRVYNSRLRAGKHHYTSSSGERDSLTLYHGWRDEGTGFYAAANGKPQAVMKHKDYYYCQMNIPASWEGMIEGNIIGHTSGAYHIDFRFGSLATSVYVFRIDGMYIKGVRHDHYHSGIEEDGIAGGAGALIWDAAHGSNPGGHSAAELDRLIRALTGGSLTRSQLLAQPNRAACISLAQREINKYFNAWIIPSIKYLPI